MPILIGGAATSKAHTALKIAPMYRHGVIHCLDASKSVEVAAVLCDPHRRNAYLAQIDESYGELARQITRLSSETISLEDARMDRLRDGYAPHPVRPAKPGVTRLTAVGVRELRPFINWNFFLKAWQMQGTVEKVLLDPEKGPEARRLLADAHAMLDTWETDQDIGLVGVFGLFPALALQEDVLVHSDEVAFQQGGMPHRIHLPRQISRKASPHLSLADFILPSDKADAAHPHDWLGMFAVSAGLHADPVIEAAKAAGDDYRAIMIRLLCDRLAEAYAEWIHLRIRRMDWGFVPDEDLTMADLIHEKYVGIRPRTGLSGLPGSCPETGHPRLARSGWRNRHHPYGQQHAGSGFFRGCIGVCLGESRIL